MGLTKGGPWVTLKVTPLVVLMAAFMIFSHAGLQGGGRKKPAEQEPADAAQSTPTTTPVDVQVLPGMGLPGMDAEKQTAEPPPAPSAEAKYQSVWIWQETNDCLWKMAKDHYGDPFLWPKIYEANRGQIKDPAVIFPKQKIIIPPLEGVSARPVPAPRPPVAAEPLPPAPTLESAEEQPQEIPTLETTTGEPPLEIPAWLLEPDPATETPAETPPAE